MFKYNIKTLASYLPISLMLICLISINIHKPVTRLKLELRSVVTPMYFTGIAKPLRMINVVSPFDGIVTRVMAKSGSNVKKGEVLFYIQSAQLQKNFRSALTDYLKAKVSYQNMQYQHAGNQELFKNGLISKVSFLETEEQFRNNQLALWDAQEVLIKILLSTDISSEEIEKLSLSDIDRVKTIIARVSGEIKIIAPDEGILSSQSKRSSGSSSDSSSDKDEGISEGTNVKQGEIIAIIYEMTGLNFKVNVTENQFHDITLGQTATITGTGFPSITLKGTVSSINHEANTAQGGGIPTYTIRIIVPKLTMKERSLIQEGMSAEITLFKTHPPAIRIPISAITEKDNVFYVSRFYPSTGNTKDVPVTLGSTDEDSVEITKGLSEGDEIVIPN